MEGTDKPDIYHEIIRPQIGLKYTRSGVTIDIDGAWVVLHTYTVLKKAYYEIDARVIYSNARNSGANVRYIDTGIFIDSVLKADGLIGLYHFATGTEYNSVAVLYTALLEVGAVIDIKGIATDVSIARMHAGTFCIKRYRTEKVELL